MSESGFLAAPQVVVKMVSPGLFQSLCTSRLRCRYESEKIWFQSSFGYVQFLRVSKGDI